MAAILTDATNLGLGRMAESSQGLTHARLIWTAQWHRDETYAAALAAIIDYHHVLPHSAIWGAGTGASSDSQFYGAGAKGEGRADYNAKYGSDSGVLFYSHVSDRSAPFHSKVIAANVGEATHVIDGLLNHESQLEVKKHATDTAGAVDHAFGLCHLLGFRFAARILDLSESRLYTLSPKPGPTGPDRPGRCKPQHRCLEFRSFLDEVQARATHDLEVHLNLDNLVIHKAAIIKDWLVERQCSHLHFMPTYAS